VYATCGCAAEGSATNAIVKTAKAPRFFMRISIRWDSLLTREVRGVVAAAPMSVRETARCSPRLRL